MFFSDYTQKLLPVLTAIKSEIEALIADQGTEGEENSGSQRREIFLNYFFLNSYSVNLCFGYCGS